MNGYIGCSKKDIEYLIETVNAPGILVKRRSLPKKQFGVLYRFFDGAKNLFSLRCMHLSDRDSMEISISCGADISDTLCEGDAAYRKACVLYQLAEKMYETQRRTSIKSVEKSLQLQQAKIFCKMLSRIK